MKIKEPTLYPCVEEPLGSETFGCFKTAQKAGTSFIGIADVIGARDVGGDVCGDIEIVAVEVKINRKNFGKILGQALGYSLFAQKCYLAVYFSSDDTFSLEQKELATRLGVGLMEIKKSYNVLRCSEILTSAIHQPQPHQFETILRRGFNLVKCSSCGFFVDVSKSTTSLSAAVKNDKVYLSWRKPDRSLLFSRRRRGDWRRLYICSDCVKQWNEIDATE
jgi:hypothetical protein